MPTLEIKNSDRETRNIKLWVGDQIPGDRIPQNSLFNGDFRQMQIKITRKDSFCLLEILADNGEPASGQNPINEAEELGNVEFPEASGTLLIISGMPASAQCACTFAYKGTFGAIALANPRAGVAYVVGSVNKAYPVGSSVPLA